MNDARTTAARPNASAPPVQYESDGGANDRTAAEAARATRGGDRYINGTPRGFPCQLGHGTPGSRPLLWRPRH
jgi:hypothetical protein